MSTTDTAADPATDPATDTTAPAKARETRNIIAAVVLTLVFVLALLLFQSERGGWPFAPDRPLVDGTTASVPVTPSGVDREHVAHRRVPIEVDATQQARIGVRVETARTEALSTSIGATATVVPDESRLSRVQSRVSGWVERLHVSTTGEQVARGDPVAEIFSQELFASQMEFLAALSAAGDAASPLVEGARSRLATLGMSQADIRALERRGQARRLVTVSSPRSGVVLNLGVTVGAAIDPSTELVTIADLSTVWVIAEVPEAHGMHIEEGMTARLTFPSAGLVDVEARVTFLYPTLSERTRTLRVRFDVDNDEGVLRPGLYGTAEFQLAPRQGLTVNRDAVIYTGMAQHVFVATEPGRFEPRTVQTGARVGDRLEITGGLAPGERVVASGVFLIDSESRLRASGGGPAHGGHGAPTPAPTPAPAGDDPGDEDQDSDDGSAPTDHGGH
jgi:membrane fusion protein, copper/silver efflux system